MKKFSLYISAIACTMLMAFFGVSLVKANSSRIAAPAPCTTSGTFATTSIRYMTPGTGTTTVSCDLQYMANLNGGAQSIDSAILAVQFHASSTDGSELNWNIELSQNGQDWYKEKLFSVASTSYVIGNARTYSWRQYASTTQSYSLSGLATSSVSMAYFSLPSDTKYVRVPFSVPTGSLNAGVWAQIIGKSEVPNQ